MSIIMVIIFLIILMIIGVPVAFAVLIPSLCYLAFNGIPLESAIGRMSGTINSFTVMAVPFFIIAGQIMNQSGLTSRLISFTKCLESLSF